MATKFRRKINPVKIGKNLINFAVLCSNQNDANTIDYENRKLFELFNPQNRYRLELGYKIFNDYNEKFKNTNLFLLNNLKDFLLRIASSNKLKKEFIDELTCDKNDFNTARNDFKIAMISDLKCKIATVFCDNTVNPIDFCFDSTKRFNESEISGIKIGEKGFLNPSSFTLTAFINTKYLSNIIFNMSVNEYLDDVAKALAAAILKDNYRIIYTEQMMIFLNLLSKGNFSSANTTNGYMHTFALTEKYKELVDLFLDANSNAIKCLDNDFSKLFNILRGFEGNIDPVNVLGIIEPSDNDVNKLLNSVFPKMSSNLDHFASSSTLFDHDKDEQIVSDAKSLIIANRLLPLLFFTSICIHNSSKYETFKKIDDAIEGPLHSISLYGDLRHINAIHEVNDEFYDEMRKAFRNLTYASNKVVVALFIAISKTFEPVADEGVSLS